MAMNIFTLKVGQKYSADYVNKLYTALLRQSTAPFDFYCYTEDPSDLIDGIKIIPLEDPGKLKLQWHKLEFHRSGFANVANGEMCLILDIDWIIINEVDEILLHKLKPGQFGCFERWWSNRREWCKLNGGFQMYRMGDTHHMYETFMKKPEYWQEYFINKGEADGPVNGEQNFIDMHAGDNRHWFPMEWFAKWDEDSWPKIQKNWQAEVNPDHTDPYYFYGMFDERIKMVHFSNAENMIHAVEEDWIGDFWYK